MPGETKRCLYEVLGVSRDASPEEIRSSYRKLALQLHPDKVASAGGPTSHAAATAAFQELVNAYEVLSDPRERSYYDSHRSQILFADASSTSSSKSSFSSFFGVDIFSFFSSSAYSGFSDTGRGFYRVYGDLFASIYDQELKFRSRMGLPSDAVPPAPLMGNLDSPYAQVTAFYGYWMGFCSVMDFAWVDVYDAAAGENRRSRRAMEEENRKLRKKARKEYNDSVRGLAEFVKKRDKRVIDMALKRKEEEDRRRVEAQEKRKDEERKKAEKARLYEEPEWARIDEDEEEEVIFKDDAGKKGGEDELLYCVVCSKKFKSEKQWRNHEQSKKHRDKVAELRDALSDEEDDESINRDADVEEDVEANKDDEVDGDDVRKVSEDDGDENDGEVDEHYADELCEEFHDAVRLEEEKDGVAPSGLNDQHEEDTILEAMVSGHKSRKGDRKDQLDDSFTEAFHCCDESEEDSSMTYDNRKKGRRNRAKRKGGKGNVDESVPKRDLNEATKDRDGIEHIGDDAKDMSPSSVHLVDAKRSNARDHTTAKYPKNIKQQVNEKGSNRGKKSKGASKSSNLCETCGQTFDSRNKLFMHLGETGHAMLKSH